VSAEEALRPIILVALACPIVLLAALALGALAASLRPIAQGAFAGRARRLAERIIGYLAVTLMSCATIALVAAAFVLAGAPGDRVVLSFGRLFEVEHGSFTIELFVDSVSLAFAILTTGICTIVAAFSGRYLQREPGFTRFFFYFAMFVTGMLLVVLAGTIEVLFAGWELLGLSSAMLVAFFHDRPAPLRNAMNVIVVYRVSDAAMLSAAILSHHFIGHGSLDAIFGSSTEGDVLSASESTLIACLLAIAAAGKCAQLPLSGWFPRAMEGPTPSSAIFYGALSVHAGAYLLLRAQPTIERAPIAAILIVLMGATTAIYATLVGRVQTDIKSSLAFASLTQVSVILVEIAIGLTWLPLIHTAGHACLRLLQFLRSPSVLHDFHEARNAVRARRLAPHPNDGPAHLWLYRFALERGYLDAGIARLIVRPVVELALLFDGLDRKLCALLGGRAEPSTKERS
jgi:NADH-quinone oxidoreductase subunit L